MMRVRFMNSSMISMLLYIRLVMEIPMTDWTTDSSRRRHSTPVLKMSPELIFDGMTNPNPNTVHETFREGRELCGICLGLLQTHCCHISYCSIECLTAPKLIARCNLRQTLGGKREIQQKMGLCAGIANASLVPRPSLPNIKVQVKFWEGLVRQPT